MSILTCRRILRRENAAGIRRRERFGGVVAAKLLLPDEPSKSCKGFEPRKSLFLSVISKRTSFWRSCGWPIGRARSLGVGVIFGCVRINEPSLASRSVVFIEEILHAYCSAPDPAQFAQFRRLLAFPGASRLVVKARRMCFAQASLSARVHCETPVECDSKPLEEEIAAALMISSRSMPSAGSPVYVAVA